jgi:hypothetical protein
MFRSKRSKAMFLQALVNSFSYYGGRTHDAIVRKVAHVQGETITASERLNVVKGGNIGLLGDSKCLQQVLGTVDLGFNADLVGLCSGLGADQSTFGGCRPKHQVFFQVDLVDVNSGHVSFQLGLLKKGFAIVALILESTFELFASHRVGNLDTAEMKLIQRAVEGGGFIPAPLHRRSEAHFYSLALLEVLFKGDKDSFVLNSISCSGKDHSFVGPSQFFMELTYLLFNEKKGEINVDFKSETDRIFVISCRKDREVVDLCNMS